MNKLIPEYSIFTIKMYNGKHLIIENYKQLIDIEDNVIKVDNYLLKGENLKINSLNQFMIEIYGTIKEIVIE